jgi:hypothetical protein
MTANIKIMVSLDVAFYIVVYTGSFEVLESI